LAILAASAVGPFVAVEAFCIVCCVLECLEVIRSDDFMMETYLIMTYVGPPAAVTAGAWGFVIGAAILGVRMRRRDAQKSVAGGGPH
jgi:hypothetical protein